MRYLILPAILLLAAAAVATPPAGRPPIGALERHTPRIYDVAFEVTLEPDTSPRRDPAARYQYQFEEATIFFPLILQSTFSRVDADSLDAKLWLDEREVPGVNEQGRLDSGLPFNTHLAAIPVPEFLGDRVRWRFSYRVQTWSSRINDELAGNVAWPRDWPAEVQDGLRPQRFIESDDPIFRETIERVSDGQLRLVPPYYAAKDIIRYTLQQLQVSEGPTIRRPPNLIEGLNINGAKAAATSGTATPHDLVCVCVAMLRAAGIPARPVIGVRRIPPRNNHELVSWAEFYLPDAGWIPFDPMAMRGKGLHREVHESWPELGTIRDLNERIPLSFHFTPVRAEAAPQYPAIWGWQPGRHAIPPTKQNILVTMSYQGRGDPDPH